MSEPAEAAATLGAEARRTLLQVARRSIANGLARGQPLPVHPAEYPPELKALRASFVTLKLAGELRGCIGHLQAVQPLVVDVAENAYRAAFNDPRFAPLGAGEITRIRIHVAVLSPPQPLQFSDEQDLLAQLRPGEDGLILSDGANRGTFLPSVWESLPDPRDFLAQLKRKAGLAANHWSPQLAVSRYRTESFGED